MRIAYRQELPKRPFLGASLMVAGAAIMFLGMVMLVRSGAMENGQLTGMGMAGTLVLGLIFIGAQSYGSMWLLKSVLSRETKDFPNASNSEDLEK